MTPEQKAVFSKRVVNDDYIPPTPFFFGVDYDGLICHERELLAQNNQCCPKCSGREWIHDGSIVMKCMKCEYLTTVARLKSVPYEEEPEPAEDDDYDPDEEELTPYAKDVLEERMKEVAEGKVISTKELMDRLGVLDRKQQDELMLVHAGTYGHPYVAPVEKVTRRIGDTITSAYEVRHDLAVYIRQHPEIDERMWRIFLESYSYISAKLEEINNVRRRPDTD